MKLTAILKLQPTTEQIHLLWQTLVTANAACGYISGAAWRQKAFKREELHALTYYEVRQQFGLSSQLAVRCIGKVVDAYKTDKNKNRTFKSTGGVAYDNRILGFDLENKIASIWVVAGKRIFVPFECGMHHYQLLQAQRGESDLLYRDGAFYLHTACEIKEQPLYQAEEFLGVDLGIVNIAADSDGERYSGAHLNGLRHRHFRLRQKLQKKRTKAARRLLKRRAQKEKRFASNVNHCISKQLVEKAKGTGRGIALEDLTGISDRVTVHKRFRRQLHNWSFYNLQLKLAYKAKRAGVPLGLVDPRNTSRTCPACGTIDKRNRSTQAVFHCIHCGFADHADTVAARNIARRAVVNPPYISPTVRQ